MTDFGWDYPPGVSPADPRAPWNQGDAVWCANPNCENTVDREGDLCEDCTDD